MSPMISPVSTEISASETARKLPKAFETACASSSMAASPARRRNAVPQFKQPARLEALDQHDDAAIEDVGEAGAATAEPGVRCGLQRDENDRAQQGAEQRAGATERGDDHYLHGNENAESAFGIDEAGLDRIKRTRNRRERRAEHQRLYFRLPHRYAKAARGAFAGFDGAQVIAEFALLDGISHVEQDSEYAEEDVVVRQLAAKRQVPPAARGGGALQADRCADEVPGAGEYADQFRDRDRRHAEIMAGQPECRRADDDGQDYA